MLVVDPERRLSLEQISHHRWLSVSSGTFGELNTEQADQMKSTLPSQQLDGAVVAHMLKLPQLTFDEIAESVHQQTFNHIYAIYNLLLDKLSLQQHEEQRLQQHLGTTFSR